MALMATFESLPAPRRRDVNTLTVNGARADAGLSGSWLLACSTAEALPVPAVSNHLQQDCKGGGGEDPLRLRVSPQVQHKPGP
jgi:hypothetical protein